MSAGEGGLRQSMAWLHTWTGLWFCWLLFAIFLTGTLAVFEEPISHWMTPEHHAADAAGTKPASPIVDRRTRLAAAVTFLQREQPQAGSWEIWPANPQHDGNLTVYWQERGEFVMRVIDPLTGQARNEADDHPAAGRESEGGHHFVEFHYTLHAGTAGIWIVGVATLAMLVALVSGVITHKRIFKDFFTFRTGKGQRSWLDGHNAVAVLSLPFQFMIAFTGIAFYATTYMPAARLAAPARSRPPVSVPAGPPLAVPDLEVFAQKGERLIGQETRAVVVRQPGQSAMTISVYGQNDQKDRARRIVGTDGMAAFSPHGALTDLRRPGTVSGGGASLTMAAMRALHMAEFGGTPVKWLYFLCGLAGTAMMGTGAILFIVKRRNRHGREFGAATAHVYRLIEGLNVAAIAGLSVASIAYLWANRLIPVALPHRATWEVGTFFLVWLLALGHAFARPPSRAWMEQLAVLVFLCLGLPLLNLVTVGDYLGAQIARGDWESAGVELTTLAFGAAAAAAATIAVRRRTGKAEPPRHRARPMQRTEATR